MILAAGLGTRLQELTGNRPKALVEWQGVPLLEHVVTRLKSHGFTEIIINVHHFADKIIEYVDRKHAFGIRVEISDESSELLDTGGAIAHASWFFGEQPFLVHNVDILSNINLSKLYREHIKSGAEATLAVKERVTTRSLLMDPDGLLAGWRDNRSGETILVKTDNRSLTPIAYSGIHVMDPALFTLFPEEKKFALIPFYLEAARTRRIQLYRHDRDTWTDMGKVESYN